MQSQHEDWLRALASAGKGGVTLPQIDRGLPYSLVVKIPIDVSTDAFTASLRTAPDAVAPVLASFSVTVGAWDGAYTPVTFNLNQTQVNALPADSDADGLTELVMDILRTPSGGTQYRYLGGNIYISGKVTIGA